MLAGMGANFLYTVVSRCKAASDQIFKKRSIPPRRGISPRFLLFRARAGPVNRRSKKFVIRPIR